MAELLRTIHISESIVGKLENSTAGHFAIAFLCYKIVSPLRYMVTIGEFRLLTLYDNEIFYLTSITAYVLYAIGITTFAINYLSRRGYIRPMPSTTKIIKMCDQKAAQVKKSCEDAMSNYKKGQQQ